jgi:transposase
VHIVFNFKGKNDMRKDTQIKHSKSKKTSKLPIHLSHINKMAAGIDIGSKSHFVAVPEGIFEESVREFQSFTNDLHALADWLEACCIETVAMESTGVYWVPLYELLESRGFEVLLVDARHVKNVSGRKTDVLDCQWLQQLHTYGLLNSAFRPSKEICTLRVYLRQRSMLIQRKASHIQHMQKSLDQMNLQLHNVLSDITGETGMTIIRAIASGMREPKLLASYRNYRCKNSLEVIEKSLTGNYSDEHIFTLNQALFLYDAYQTQVEHCLSQFDYFKENALEKPTKMKSRTAKDKNAPLFDLHHYLRHITGIDLTAIPGIEAYSALKIISEIGLDMSRWKTSKAFASWLGLCPGNKVSGGKRQSGKTKRTSNYAASTLRIAAGTLHRSQSSLGAFLRRLKSRMGSPKAITATAHKLAVIIYNMLKNKQEYIKTDQDYYETKFRERLIKSLTARAKSLGFDLIENLNLSDSYDAVI